jgi:hypothetical protein
MPFKKRDTLFYTNETLFLFHLGFLETYVIRFPDDILFSSLKELIQKGVKRYNG